MEANIVSFVILFEFIVSGAEAVCDTSSTMAFCVGNRSITSIPTSFPSNITELIVDGANISDISFADFADYRQLEHVAITDSGLQTIAADTFEGLTGLIDVDVSDNPFGVDVVDLSWVLAVGGLRTLTIVGNSLPVIQSANVSDQTALPVVANLDLTGQPLHCNCELGWLRNWTTEIAATGTAMAVCATPSFLAGSWHPFQQAT